MRRSDGADISIDPASTRRRRGSGERLLYAAPRTMALEIGRYSNAARAVW